MRMAGIEQAEEEGRRLDEREGGRVCWGRIPSLAGVRGWPSTHRRSLLWGQHLRIFHGAEAPNLSSRTTNSDLSSGRPSECWVIRWYPGGLV